MADKKKDISEGADRGSQAAGSVGAFFKQLNWDIVSFFRTARVRMVRRNPKKKNDFVRRVRGCDSGGRPLYLGVAFRPGGVSARLGRLSGAYLAFWGALARLLGVSARRRAIWRFGARR